MSCGEQAHLSNTHVTVSTGLCEYYIWLICFCLLWFDKQHCLYKHPTADAVATIGAVRHWGCGMCFSADLNKNHLCDSEGAGVNMWVKSYFEQEEASSAPWEVAPWALRYSFYWQLFAFLSLQEQDDECPVTPPNVDVLLHIQWKDIYL